MIPIFVEKYEFNQLTINLVAWSLVQSIVIYSAGIKLYLHLHSKGASDAGATIACLIVSVLIVIPIAEVFYRLVEIPSQGLQR